jgi:CII-binding regulator of phage lambda lysogenization HflD
VANETEWHLSKSVPLTFIMAIVGQTIALVWFVASLDSEIESNTRELVRHETRLIALEASVQAQAVAMGRIDENIKAIKNMMERVSDRDDPR